MDRRSVPARLDCHGETLPPAMRLATLRSLQYYQDLMEGIRSTLAEGRFAARKMETLARLAEGVWTPPAVPAKERRERSIR